jgi:beta-glucanase (GH16 family)
MVHSNIVVGDDGSQGGQFLYADRDFNKQWYYWRAPFNFSDDFHVFAALWDTDDTVSFFIDGKLIQKRAYRWTNPGGMPGYAHVLLNLAVGGAWAGKFGIDRDAFPQALEVDYVRVYQKPDRIMLGEDRRGTEVLCRPAESC